MSIKLPRIQADNIGPMWSCEAEGSRSTSLLGLSRASTAQPHWALSFAAEGQEAGAQTQTLHPGQVSIRRRLHLTAGVHPPPLLLQPSHATSCHLQDGSSILLGVCLLLEELCTRRDLITSVMLLVGFLCKLFSRGFLSCRRKTAW